MIVCSPTSSAEVVSEALPPLTGTDPRVVKPSVKVTVPVTGPAALAGATVAVNLTGSPTFAPSVESVTTVVPVPISTGAGGSGGNGQVPMAAAALMSRVLKPLQGKEPLSPTLARDDLEADMARRA